MEITMDCGRGITVDKEAEGDRVVEGNHSYLFPLGQSTAIDTAMLAAWVHADIATEQARDRIAPCSCFYDKPMLLYIGPKDTSKPYEGPLYAGVIYKSLEKIWVEEE